MHARRRHTRATHRQRSNAPEAEGRRYSRMVLRIPWTAGVRRLLPSLVLTYLRAQLLSLLMVRPELDGDVDVLPSERWPPERLREETSCRGYDEMRCFSLSVIRSDRIWIALQRRRLDLPNALAFDGKPNASERPVAWAKQHTAMQHTTYTSDATYNYADRNAVNTNRSGAIVCQSTACGG